jgi:hypothetical protein
MMGAGPWFGRGAGGRRPSSSTIWRSVADGRVQREKEEAYGGRIPGYNRLISTVAIGVAVLLLVGSILWLSRLPEIGEGTTLGAVFTLFYGLIRAFMTDGERFRFVAVAAGREVLVALVYWKFARLRDTGPCGQRPAVVQGLS